MMTKRHGITITTIHLPNIIEITYYADVDAPERNEPYKVISSSLKRVSFCNTKAYFIAISPCEITAVVCKT